MAVEKFIPIHDASRREDEMPAESADCASREPYALMVLGDSMEPEFLEREIIIIEPNRAPQNGSYVVAFHNEEHTFRQYVEEEGRCFLKPVNPAYPIEEVSGPEVVKGVIIQKRGHGGRRDRKFYS